MTDSSGTAGLHDLPLRGRAPGKREAGSEDQPLSEAQWARQEAGLDLAETLRWCIAQVAPVADRRRIVVEADLDPVRVLHVEDHLKMMLVNLVANAVSYSHDGGCVRVRCYPEGTTRWS